MSDSELEPKAPATVETDGVPDDMSGAGAEPSAPDSAVESDSTSAPVSEPAEEQEPAHPANRPNRRRTVRYASAVVAVLAIVGMMFIKIPYVMETPGPTVNTLGQQNGKDLIQTPKSPDHRMTGQLRLVTVSVYGSDPGSLNIAQALWGWVSPHATVLPYEAVYPPNSTSKQRDQIANAQMMSSQDGATVAALTALGYTITMKVASVEGASDAQGRAESSPAQGKLAVGDQITSVNGVALKNFEQLKAVMNKVRPGQNATVGFTRAGKAQTTSIRTADDGSGHALLGVGVTFTAPVTVNFDIDGIGGPSAGMMFALGIVDKLGSTDLTGGKVIAGTGTMDATGQVGAIGGIDLKMVAAKRDGATYFFAPSSNCDDVVGHVPSGLQVVKVSTLNDAINALSAIRAGKSASLPTCTASK